jgi:hypothetical protein
MTSNIQEMTDMFLSGPDFMIMSSGDPYDLDVCIVESIPEFQYPSDLAMMVQLNSPYAEILVNFIIKAICSFCILIFNCFYSQTKSIERGVYHQSINRWSTKIHCTSEQKSKLGMDQVYTIFVFLGTATHS